MLSQDKRQPSDSDNCPTGIDQPLLSHFVTAGADWKPDPSTAKRLADVLIPFWLDGLERDAVLAVSGLNRSSDPGLTVQTVAARWKVTPERVAEAAGEGMRLLDRFAHKGGL